MDTSKILGTYNISRRFRLLWGNKVTDPGLVHLMGLTKLQGLELSCTKITIVGMVDLEGLSNLQSLSLDITEITDVGPNILRD